MMELKEAIYKRKSVRRFSNEKISKDKIEEIISAGCFAPSACNKRLWRYIVIDDDKIKQRIVEEGGAIFIRNSPLGILVLYGNCTDNNAYQDHIQSAAAAIQNMLLTATSLGISSCWVCHLPAKSTLRKLLNIPRYFDPVAYIVLGYPVAENSASSKKIRSSFNEVASWNRFDFKTPKPAIMRGKLKSFFRQNYFYLPLSLKKFLRPIAEKFVKKFDE